MTPGADAGAVAVARRGSGPRVLRVLRAAILGLAGAGYLGLCYAAAAWPHPPRVAVVTGLLPLLGIAFAAAWRSPWRLPATAVVGALLGALLLDLGQLQRELRLVYLLQHAGAMTVLGYTFGSTLTAGRERALCSRIARVAIAGDIAPDYYLYTWRVTLAWTVFFATMALVSVLLFAFGPIAWWSLLANVLTPVLVGAMFVGEYAVRLRALPDRPHMSVAQTVAAWRSFRRSGA